MTYKEILLDELKKEFFPYDKDEFEDKIINLYNSNGLNQNTGDGYYFTDSMYGKKFTVVFHETAMFIFLHNSENLVILVVTSFHGFTFRDSLKRFETQSVTNIDIVADDSWETNNLDIMEISKFISKNSCHIGNEYLIKGSDNIIDFEERHLNSPLLWYLLRDTVPHTERRRRVGSSVKTKSNFLPGLIRVVLNSINIKKKSKIENKNFDVVKEKLFNYFTQKLLRPNPRKYLMQDIATRNGVVFSSTIYSDLFASVSYDKEDWNNHINAEIISYLKEDYLSYIENISLEDGVNGNIASAVLHSLNNNPLFKKGFKDKYDFVTKDMVSVFLYSNNKEYYNKLIEELILFVKDNFNNNNMLSGTYFQRLAHIEDIPFADKLFEEIGEKILKEVNDIDSAIHSLDDIGNSIFNNVNNVSRHSQNAMRPQRVRVPISQQEDLIADNIPF